MLFELQQFAKVGVALQNQFGSSQEIARTCYNLITLSMSVNKVVCNMGTCERRLHISLMPYVRDQSEENFSLQFLTFYSRPLSCTELHQVVLEFKHENLVLRPQN